MGCFSYLLALERLTACGRQKAFGDDILIGTIVGGTTGAIEAVQNWRQFAADLREISERLHEEARRKYTSAIAKFNELAKAAPDFIHIVNDFSFNPSPFIAPRHIHELILPFLAE